MFKPLVFLVCRRGHTANPAQPEYTSARAASIKKRGESRGSPRVFHRNTTFMVQE
jgi:hypothetical protein